MLQARREAADVAEIGYPIFLVVADIDHPLGARREKMRLNEIDRSPDRNGRILCEHGQTAAAAQPILVAPFQLGAKPLLGAVSQPELDFPVGFFCDFYLHRHDRRIPLGLRWTDSDRGE